MRAAIISISTSRAPAVAPAGLDPGTDATVPSTAPNLGTDATVSTTAPDLGGDALEHYAADVLGATIAGRELIPDDAALIAQRLTHWADAEGVELILSTGGTGFAPSDVTPEATRSVLEREAPGLAEAMRAASMPYTPHWMLSRGVAGIRGATLIVNFPGNPRSIAQTGGAIAAALPHAVALITGEPGPGASHAAGSRTTPSH